MALVTASIALVVLNYDIGDLGTIFIFSDKVRRPMLLAFFRSGVDHLLALLEDLIDAAHFALTRLIRYSSLLELVGCAGVFNRFLLETTGRVL